MKYIITLLLLMLSSLWLSAKEYSFEISPANELYRFVVEYNSTTKEFSLTARQDNRAQASAWLLLGAAIPVETQDEPVYSKISGVTLSLSTANNPWKGKAGELLFLDRKGNVLFGAYVDEETIGSDKRRKSYAIVNTKSGLKKWECSVMLLEDYTPYDELYAIAEASGAGAKSSLPQSIRDYITKVWGCFEVKTFADYSFKNIDNTLSSRFKREINVQVFSKDYWAFTLDNPPIKINGHQPYYIRFDMSDSDLVHLSYSYNFKFERAADAEYFANQMREMIMQQCGFYLDKLEDKRDSFCWYYGDYYCNDLKYTVQVDAGEKTFGYPVASISISVFP